MSKFFYFYRKKCHMFTKVICKIYAIHAFPEYPGIAVPPTIFSTTEPTHFKGMKMSLPTRMPAKFSQCFFFAAP
jgi:hypothetical protein